MTREELYKLHLTRASLTAPHFLAYSFVLDRLKGTERVLDFGSRYSKLPGMASLLGCRVSCFDRDPVVWEQMNIAAGMGGQIELAACGDHDCWLDVLSGMGMFDVVTACWAIQHNTPEQQAEIIKALAGRTTTGGRLIVVGSYTHGKTFHQSDRADPQWVLDFDSHAALMTASGMTLSLEPDPVRFFHYQHSTAIGDWCEAHDANAIAYELRIR